MATESKPEQWVSGEAEDGTTYIHADLGREKGDSAGDLAVRFSATPSDSNPFVDDSVTTHHPTRAAAVAALVKAAGR